MSHPPNDCLNKLNKKNWKNVKNCLSFQAFIFHSILIHHHRRHTGSNIKISCSTMTNQKMTYAPIKDTDQPWHPPSLDQKSTLTPWRKVGSLASYWVHREDSDQTVWMCRLIWVFTWCTGHFVIPPVYEVYSFCLFRNSVCVCVCVCVCKLFFFVQDVSGTTETRILKFSTNVGYNLLYCVRENQPPPAYHSHYLSIFLSLQ